MSPGQLDPACNGSVRFECREGLSRIPGTLVCGICSSDKLASTASHSSLMMTLDHFTTIGCSPYLSRRSPFIAIITLLSFGEETLSRSVLGKRHSPIAMPDQIDRQGPDNVRGSPMIV